MDLKIKALDKTNMDDLFRLFEDSKYLHQREWKNCYCVYYHTSYQFNEWVSRTGKTNKAEAINMIEENKMNGFLAYEDDLCVGWLNAGCVLNYDRLQEDISPEFLNDKTALTICFVIHEEHRGKNIVSALLDHAIEAFREKGFKQMIALPFDSPIRERNYRGFTEMYLRRGYKVYKKIERINLLVLNL